MKTLSFTVFTLFITFIFHKPAFAHQKLAFFQVEKAISGSNTTPLNWTCITSFPTTTFVTETKNDEVELTVIHHNGHKYVPVYNGPVTISDIPLLQTRGEIFKQTGDIFTLKFDLKECEKTGDWQYACFTDQKTRAGNIDIESAYIYTTKAKEWVMGTALSKVTTTLSIRVGSFYHDTSMNYYDKECSEATRL